MDEHAVATLMSGIRVVLLGAFFCIGYFGAEKIEKRYGQGAAKLPPAVWGLLFAFCLLPALVAAIIVNYRAKKRFNGVQSWPPVITYPPAAQQHPPTDSPPPPSPGFSGGGGGSSPGQTILPGQ